MPLAILWQVLNFQFNLKTETRQRRFDFMWVFKFSKLTTIRLVCCTNNNDNNNKKNEIGAKVASETRWRTKVCRYWSTKDSRPSRTRNRNEKKEKKRTNHLRPRRLEGQNRSHHESSESKWRLFGGCLEGKTPREMIRVQSFFFVVFISTFSNTSLKYTSSRFLHLTNTIWIDGHTKVLN